MVWLDLLYPIHHFCNVPIDTPQMMSQSPRFRQKGQETKRTMTNHRTLIQRLLLQPTTLCERLKTHLLKPVNCILVAVIPFLDFPCFTLVQNLIAFLIFLQTNQIDSRALCFLWRPWSISSVFVCSNSFQIQSGVSLGE